MHFTRASLLLSSFLISISAAAQQPQRDPEAVAVLNQMILLTGWASPPNDAMAQGTLIHYQGESSSTGSVVLKSLGPSMLRTDLQTPAGMITTLRNGGRAAIVKAGTVSRIAGHVAVTLDSYHFPFFSSLMSFSDPRTAVLYQGTKSINGELAHQIELQGRLDLANENHPLRRASRITVWVSATSFLPLQLGYYRIAGDNSSISLRCTRSFSDYRRIGGVMVPFAQIDLTEGKKLLELRFDAVELNVGLNPSDFDVPF